VNNSEYRSVITIVLLSTLLILLILCFIGLIFYGAWQGGWFGIFAPTGTPKAVIVKLNESINVVLKMPDIRERLARQGLIPGGGSPEGLRDLLSEDLSKWGKLIKEIGIKTSE
jgi:tripartite-type tricarboxylate transporter receptor subunit TctC